MVEVYLLFTLTAADLSLFDTGLSLITLRGVTKCILKVLAIEKTKQKQILIQETKTINTSWKKIVLLRFPHPTQNDLIETRPLTHTQEKEGRGAKCIASMTIGHTGTT